MRGGGSGERGGLFGDARKEYGSVGVGSCEGRLQDCVQGAEWAAEMRASLYRQRNQSYPGWTLTSALNYSHVSDPKTKMLGILQEGGSVWYH